jgi:sterol desaturase/sphingolipid hydroxylase (fatty acid hydroxylase superfamily)
MDKLETFFLEMPPAMKLVWIFICLSTFWIAENIAPLIQFKYQKWSHAKTNLIFLLFTIIINGLIGVLFLKISDWQVNNNFGLFYHINLPKWVVLLLSIMLLDLIAQYCMHVLLHKIKFMWKFHLVHHSDIHLDATSGTRHHPGDFLMRELASGLTLFIFGFPLAYYLCYRILSIFFTYFTHANISLPLGIDKVLSYIFITPNIHKFHHHFERPWTDTNFGNIFSIWDRVFGTLVYDDPHKIKYGVDVLDDSTAGDLGYQLKIPFNRSIKTDY